MLNKCLQHAPALIPGRLMPPSFIIVVPADHSKLFCLLEVVSFSVFVKDVRQILL